MVGSKSAFRFRTEERNRPIRSAERAEFDKM